jgi:hypothetical protein
VKTDIRTRRRIEMNKTRIVGILAGAIFFGIAMSAREYANTMWLRSVIAGIGGLGLGIAIVFAQRKQQPKEE